MQLSRRVCLGTALTLLPAAAAAASLEERLRALETRDAEIYHTLEERKRAGAGSAIAEHLTLSGLVELELAFERLQGDADETASDLTLATAQLGLEAAIAEPLGATLILLYEEEEDAVIEVDEATLDYARGPWSARVGRQYLPFGVFASHFVSDPLTLELGETREVALLAALDHVWLSAAAFAANGDAKRHADTGHLNDWGASLTLQPHANLQLAASVFSDLADSDAELVGNYEKRVFGWSAYGQLGLGPVEVHAEVLGAARTFAAADLDADGDGAGDRPYTWNAEIAYYHTETLELAGRVEGSREFAEQPELQYGACASWGIWEGVSLSLEYLRGEFDPDFGGGLDSRDLVTAQLAAEF